MMKSLFEENGGTYRKVGEYQIPNLALEDQAGIYIGKYGMLRKSYLKEHRPVIYTNLLTSCKLHEHLTEIAAQAHERLELIMKQMAAAQGMTEELKSTDQMAWVGAMNNIKACAEEIVFTEIIYA